MTFRRFVLSWRSVAALIAVACLTELFARFGLGLGDPPLYQTHPTMEYLLKPNQTVHPFGRTVQINRYGMRSADFSPTKAGHDELRVMVYGDSVINGGSLCDQPRIATSVLRQRLSDSLHKVVIVGNVSAGSWGPPNQLAHIDQFGFLDADIAIFVLSSSDFDDAPTFEPLDPGSHPTVRPLSAAWVGATIYLPRYWHTKGFHDDAMAPDPDAPVNPRDVEVSLSAMRQFLMLAKQQGIRAYVVQHWAASELRSGHPQMGHGEIMRIATESNVEIFQDGPALQESLQAGVDPYRDDIHLNDAGQGALAKVLFNVITRDADLRRP